MGFHPVTTQRTRAYQLAATGLALTATIAAAAGCSAPGSSPSAITIVTSNVGFLYGPLYVAAGKNYFKSEGVDVDIKDGGGGSVAVASVIGGSAQMGAVGLGNVANALTQGQKLSPLAGLANDLPFTLVAQKDASVSASSSLKQKLQFLSGKTVAVPDIGGSGGAVVRYLLTANGMNADAIKLINMPDNAAQLAALKSNRIAGFVNGSPVTDEAVAAGTGKVLIDGSDFPAQQGMAYMALAAKPSFVQSQKSRVSKVLTALTEAEKLIADDPGQAEAAFYRTFDQQSGGATLPQRVKDLAWRSSLPTMARSLVISSAAVDKGRSVLGVPKSVKTSDLVTGSLADEVGRSGK